MATHLLLLRGVNVGGHGRLPMPTLRSILGDLGHQDVATYIQSGNAVSTPPPGSSPAALAAELTRAICSEVGFAPTVVVRTREQWDQVLAQDPYAAEPQDTAVHLVSAAQEVDAGARASLLALLQEHRDAGGPDHLTVIGATVYLHTPEGLGRSTLAARLNGAKASGGPQVTSRNRRTARHLLEMLRS